MIDLGISERLNKLVTGKTPSKQIDAPFYSNTNKDSNSMSNWSNSAPSKPTPTWQGPQNLQSTKAVGGVTGNSGGSSAPQQLNSSNTAPNGSSLGQKATAAKLSKSNSVSSQQAQNIAQKSKNDAALKAVGQSWSTSDNYLNDTKSALDNMGTLQSSLGTTRDAMLGVADRRLAKTNEAIGGNKELIARNQKNDLNNLAEDVRSKIFGSNIALGAAANGSAAGAIARMIAKAAGKNRAETLTTYGDQISAQDQEAQNATDTHELDRKKAYDWETKQRSDLLNEYSLQQQALTRLMDNVPSWKKADLANESIDNFNVLSRGLQDVATKAQSYRTYLNDLLRQANDSVVATDAANINIDKPAALDTPTFDPTLNIPMDGSTDTNATDFYNPKITGKKRYSSDIFGNPLTFDEAMAAQDPTQA